ncbi:MAG: PAS domain-containing protein [Chloroflexi bacterium]|nr:PAS domain-containing protein [Chloroflexota bacterium]
MEANQSDRFLALRQRAEALLHARSRPVPDVSNDDFLHLLNELEIYQIELELQNEELRTAQHELEQSRRQYRDLYEFAPVGYLMLDHDGVITEINLTGISMLGRDRNRILGRPLMHFVVGNDGGALHRYRQQLFTAQTIQTIDLRLSQADSTSFWARLQGVPCDGPDNDDVQLCRITMSDISVHKQAAADALALQLEQEKVEILRRFIGDMSHDLKTPLTTLKTSVYLMQQPGEQIDLAHQLNIMQGQVARLEKTLEGLLSMARLDQRSEFEFETVDLNLLVDRVCGEHRALIGQMGHWLALALPPTAPHIRGDPEQLARAFSNLIVNAINYTTPPGTITLRVHTDAEHAIIEVADTGIGIDSADLPHVFDRFFRGANARSLYQGGTGIGLAITHKIIQAHQGQLEVDSTPGMGSVFAIRLPLQRPSARR